MINSLHGKHYYIESKSYAEIRNVIAGFFDEEKALKEEQFRVVCCINSKGEPCHAIYSDSECGSFNDEKYKAWKRIKDRIYQYRKRARD